MNHELGEAPFFTQRHLYGFQKKSFFFRRWFVLVLCCVLLFSFPSRSCYLNGAYAFAYAFRLLFQMWFHSFFFHYFYFYYIWLFQYFNSRQNQRVFNIYVVYRYSTYFYFWTNHKWGFSLLNITPIAPFRWEKKCEKELGCIELCKGCSSLWNGWSAGSYFLFNLIENVFLLK